MSTPTTMKAWWMGTAASGDAVLDLREVPVPRPGAGQLLVRMRSTSLNRGEFVAGAGAPGRAVDAKPAGGEGAGEVVALGDGAIGFAVGDRVVGRAAGAFAGHALMEASEAMALPSTLSWDEGAALPLTFLVAYDMLVLQGRLAAGEWLLVNGVSSGVGVACLQLGKALGARVIGTSGSQPKLDALRALGLDAPLLTRGADFAGEVMPITGGQGADLAINIVGGSVFAEDIRALAFEGRLATVGYVDGQLSATLDLEALHRKRLTLFGVSNKLRSKAQRAAAIPRFVAEVLPHVAAGRIRPRIDRVFAFEQLPEAKAVMESGGHTGKIILRAPGEAA